MAAHDTTVLTLCRNGVDLTTRQQALLFACADLPDRNARLPSTLAEWLKVRRSVITRACDRIAMYGLIKREAVPADRRMCVITLTAKGTAFVKAIRDGGEKAKLG